MSDLLNALSIDVEDYWSIFRRDWLHIEADPSDAVVRNTGRLLDVLGRHNVKATFFILGEVAERFPFLVREIAENGHEIGVHGFYHRQVFKLTEEQFRKEVSDCKKLLEDIISDSVLGHRAPAFSIMPQAQWALEVMVDEGFKYDSSVYPIKGKRYGWPGFNTAICEIELPSGRSIIEVPMSTVTVFGRNLPVAGGGYFRHFPYAVNKWAINRIHKTRPAIVYIHPYDFDTEPAILSTSHLGLPAKARALITHRLQLRNRKRMGEKLNKLLTHFEFASMKTVISQNLKVSL